MSRISGTIDASMKKTIADHFFWPASADEPGVRVCRVCRSSIACQKGKGLTNLMAHLTALQKGHPDLVDLFIEGSNKGAKTIRNCTSLLCS
jgi:hypothetical protein